jgi:hypothetical protein
MIEKRLRAGGKPQRANLRYVFEGIDWVSAA